MNIIERVIEGDDALIRRVEGDTIEKRTIPYWTTTENTPKEYLTREDIKDLGFLRSNPERAIYQHTEKQNLYLVQKFDRNLGVKDFVEETVEVYSHDGTIITLLYESTKPNKQDIKLIVNNYAA